MENLRVKFHQWFNLPYKLHSTTQGSGPVVVMLHGIATSSASWEKLIPYLKDNFTCVTIDLIGFGESPKPDWYSYTPQEHIKNIHYTLKKLKIRQSYILIGHSMGSLLGLHYAAKYPKNIERLLMLSPPIYKNKSEAVKARKIWRDVLYARAYKYVRTHKNFTLKGASGLKKLVLKNNPFSITDQTWLAFSRSLEECIEKQNVSVDLARLQCPVEIFYGTLDQLLIKNNIRMVANGINITPHITRSGHLINDKYARLVAKNLLENT